MTKTCQRCQSNRIASVCGKVRDCCSFSAGEYDRDGYVPHDMGICKGDGDYLEFEWCLECGQMQGTFPLPPAMIETDSYEDETEEEAEERRAASRPDIDIYAQGPAGVTDLDAGRAAEMFKPFEVPDGFRSIPMDLAPDRLPNAENRYTPLWKRI